MAKDSNQNALKHGIFSHIVILAHEDPEEYRQLLTALKQEWRISGPTEEDLIESYARNIWRKRRAVRHTKKWAQNAEEGNKRYAEAVFDRLKDFARQIRRGTQGPVTEENLEDKVGMTVDYFKKYIPREKYQSDAAWLSALSDRIFWLLFSKRAFAKAFNLVDVEAILLSETDLEREIGHEARLDAANEKILKRLIHVKAMRGILFGSDCPSIVPNLRKLANFASRTTRAT
jgi:hypothetical protein